MADQTAQRNIPREVPLRARLHSPEELVGALAAFASSYAAEIALARDLSPTDARRVLRKARGRYTRMMRQTLTTATWVAEGVAS
jgi:hypothetical protein